MPKQLYLCIQRSDPQAMSGGEEPSPAQMEVMFAKFNAWKEQFKEEIVDMGGRLGAGAVVTSDSTIDGPFAECKEIVGGYMIVETETLEQALEVARQSPGVFPGASVEVREISKT